MALASLDAWARLLLSGGAWREIRPRYLPRLALGLCTSCVGTILTLPERLLLGLASLVQPHRPASSRTPIVFVLGYYRSGTTHLHYLLSCDRRFITPKWFQVMAPTGWWCSWSIIRWLLVPFLSSTRPQDDVAIGPEWPAEDDFAVNNHTAASTMPGRMIVPADRLWDHYRRYQTLEALTESQRSRFRRSLRAFVSRLEWNPLRPSKVSQRMILLKSPAHTARVRELSELFGADRVRFVHLSRDPTAVLRSNIAMHRRFEPYLLADPPIDHGETIRARVVQEYDLTERAFLAQSAALAGKGGGGEDTEDGRIARVRYQDLVADPVTVLRRVYAELGLSWTDEFHRRVVRYLASVNDYRPASSTRGSADNAASDVLPELEWMLDAFNHRAPTIASPPPGENKSGLLQPHAVDGPRVPIALGPALAAFAAAALCVPAWLAVSWLAWDRMDWLVWPVGVIVGIATARAAKPLTTAADRAHANESSAPVAPPLTERGGSWSLGVLAAACTCIAMLIVAFPATAMTSDYRLRVPPPWGDVWVSTHRGLTAINNIVWIVLGLLSAYRFASRKHLTPPGDS